MVEGAQLVVTATMHTAYFHFRDCSLQLKVHSWMSLQQCTQLTFISETAACSCRCTAGCHCSNVHSLVVVAEIPACGLRCAAGCCCSNAQTEAARGQWGWGEGGYHISTEGLQKPLCSKTWPGEAHTWVRSHDKGETEQWSKFPLVL